MDTKEFTPTPKMWDYLEAWCEPGLKQTIKDMADKAGISRQTVYDWYKTDGFAEWFNGEYSKRRLMRRPGAINAMEAKAIEGDVNAYKAWMQTNEALQYVPQNNVGLTNGQGGPVEIIIPGLSKLKGEESED